MILHDISGLGVFLHDITVGDGFVDRASSASLAKLDFWSWNLDLELPERPVAPRLRSVRHAGCARVVASCESRSQDAPEASHGRRGAPSSPSELHTAAKSPP